MNTNLFSGEPYPPTPEEYALACCAFSTQNYEPVIAYFTKLRNYGIAMMKKCILAPITEQAISDRSLEQESIEKLRAKFRRIVAEASCNLGTLDMLRHMASRASAHYAQAAEFDPANPEYKTRLAVALTEKIFYERAMRGGKQK